MFILLFLFWLLLIGSITAETVVFGVLLSAVIYYLMYRLFGITPKKELRHICLLWYAPAFGLLMVWEVIKANIAVVKAIFGGKRRSVIVKKTFPLKTEFARSILANSITLTPGTITVDVADTTFTVHGLNESFAEGLDDWSVLRLLIHIERKLGYDSRKA